MKSKCTLCGFEFMVDGSNCGNCPLSKKCGVICCPNCGYQFINDEPIRRRLRNISNWFKQFTGINTK